MIIRGRAEIEDDTERVLDVLEAVQRKYNPGLQVEGLRDALRGPGLQALPDPCAPGAGLELGSRQARSPACTDLPLSDGIVLFGPPRRGGGQRRRRRGLTHHVPAAGLSRATPIIANATNTVSLSPGSLAALWGFRHELQGLGRWALWGSIPSILGGLIGGWLLLRTPARVFDWLVPWLIAFATALFAALRAAHPLGATAHGLRRGRSAASCARGCCSTSSRCRSTAATSAPAWAS